MGIENERVDVTFGAKIQDLLSGMQEGTAAVTEATESMKAHVEALNETVESVKVPFIALLAVLAGGEMFKESIEQTSALAVQLEVLAQKTGMNVEELSALKYAAELSHVSMDQLTIGLQKLARGMEAAAQGTGPAADAFDRLGISVTKADGHLRPMQDVMLDVAARFHDMKDGAEKTALAMDLFGRSGSALIPFLNRGADGIREFEAEAKKFGITMDESGVRKALEYEDAMIRVHAILSAVERDIVLALMPALTQIAAAFTSATGGASAFSSVGTALGNVMKGVAIVLLNVKLMISEVGAAWKAMGGDGVGALTALRAAWADYDKAFAALNAPVKDTSIKPGGGGDNPPPPGGEDDPLRAMQVEWDREKVANADHFGMLTQMELDFWKDKLGTVDASSKAYAQIYTRIAALTEQVDKETFAGKLASMHAQEALDKDNLEQLVADKQAELDEIRKHYKEASKEVQEGLKALNEAQHAMQVESAKSWEAAFHAIPTAFSHTTAEIGKSVQTLGDLFRTFFRDLAVMGIESAASNLAHHVAMELGKTAASTAGSTARVGVAASEQGATAAIEDAGLMHHYAVEIAKVISTVQSVAQRVAAEAAGAIATVAKSVWAGLVMIANYAATAAAGAYAAIVGIPFVGPILAPAAAGVALAGVLGLAGSLKSASGGYDIPAGINPMTQLHAQEMVLPAELANKIRGMTDGGGGPGGGNTYHIHALDAKSFVEYAKANPDAFGYGVAGAIAMNHGALGKALRGRG